MSEKKISSLAEAMELAHKQRQLENEKTLSERKSYPHIAVLTFKIDIRSLSNDNIMGESTLSKNELLRYGMSNKAQIFVKGATESECIRKVKNLLENLNVESKD